MPRKTAAKQPHAEMQPHVCGAKTRNGGKCKRAPIAGRNRCAAHGGKTPRGIASPHYQDGTHQRHYGSLPQRIRDRFDQSLNDPELLNLRYDISLLDARLADLLTRVDTGESGKHWSDARKANDEIQKALHDENWGKMLILCLQLDRTIGDAVTDIEAWGQVQSLIESRRKLVESEQKRLVAGQQMLSAEQVMALMDAIQRSIKQHVTDPKALYGISEDMHRLSMIGASQ